MPKGPPDDPIARTLDLMRDYVTGLDRGRRRAVPSPASGEPAEWDLLEQNRLANLRAGDGSPRIDAYREAIWSMNAPALSTILRVAATLTREGIPHVFIKGPLLTEALYADYFFRMSTDVDVLVASGDRTRSLRALHDLGYRSSRESETVYWRTFLGEQHLENSRSDLLTLDLHVAVRHPAGFGRTLTRDLLARRTGRPLGDGVVSVPHPMDDVLLASVYLLKALLKREPAGGHLLDCTVMRGRCDARDLRTLADLSAERGLTRTTGFAFRSAQTLMGRDDDGPASGVEPLWRMLGGEELWRRLLAPSRAKPFGRARAVAASCDHPTDRGRALAWEVARKLAQKAAHAGLF